MGDDADVKQPPAGWVAGRKSVLLAYVLWFFLGMLGAHRLYLRRWRTALAMAVLTIAGWGLSAVHFWLLPAVPMDDGDGAWTAMGATNIAFAGLPDVSVWSSGFSLPFWPLGLGALLLGALWLWLLADLVLIPFMVAAVNRTMAAEFAGEQQASAADELAKFADLRERGAISNAEYEEQKRRLLG